MDIISFQQGGAWYGLFVSSVADLVPTVRLETHGSLPPLLSGIVCYRGRPLPAIRLGPLLHPGWRAPDPPGDRCPDLENAASVLVVGTRERLLGLPSRSVGCILEVSQGRLGRRADAADSARRAQLRHADRDITVLDAARLVRLVDTALGRRGWSSGRMRVGRC